jgi:hypothetical protein
VAVICLGQLAEPAVGLHQVDLTAGALRDRDGARRPNQ